MGRYQLEEKGVEYGCLAEAMLMDALADLPHFSLFQATTLDGPTFLELSFPFQIEDDLLATLQVMRSWQKHVCSNDGDSSLWCKKHRINEAAVFKLTYELETRIRKVQQTYKVHHKPDFSGDVIGTEFLVKALVQDVFKSNLCYYAGHKSIGYREVKSHWTVDFCTPLSAKLLGVKRPPKFIIYLASSESKDKTCSLFASHVLAIDDQDAATLLAEITGETLHAFCEEHMVTSFIVSGVSDRVQQKFETQQWEEKCSPLAEELSELCLGSTVIVEYDKSAEHLRTFSRGLHHNQLQTHLQQKVQQVEQNLQQRNIEIGCPDDKSTFRVILREGIQCQSIMLPEEFRALLVLELWPHLVPRGRINKELLKMFPSGNIEYQHSVHPEHNRRILFKVTLKTAEHAMTALQKSSSELFRLCAVTFGECCNNTQEPVNEPVEFNCQVPIEVAYKMNGKERGKLDYPSLKNSIEEELGRIGMSHGAQFYISGPTVHGQNGRAIIHCQDYGTCSAIRSFLLKRKSKFVLSNEREVRQRMRTLKVTLDEGLFQVLKQPLENQNDARVDIQCGVEPKTVLLTYTNVEDVISFQTHIKEILKPTRKSGPIRLIRQIFQSATGETLRECMISKGFAFLHQPTARQYDIYFHYPPSKGTTFDMYRYVLCPGIKWYKIDLSHQRYPKGLAANLYRGDNLPEKSLKDYLQVMNVHVDIQKEFLYFHTTEKHYPSVEPKVKAYATKDVDEVDSQLPDCIACFSQPDAREKTYTLKVCGHIYCIDCLQSQIVVAVSRRVLPISCALCDGPFTCEDFLHVVRSRLIYLPANFMSVIVSDFVSTCPGRYKFCPKPNCPGVLETDKLNDQTSIICFACQGRICQKCWNLEHPEMTCGEIDDVRIAVKKWVDKSPRNRKYCPNCQMGIEKRGGCNTVSCSLCKSSICWVCMQTFEHSSTVYDHLREVHHGYY